MDEAHDDKFVTKLLTYVFEDEALLPEGDRLDLVDGIYLAQIPEILLHSDSDHNCRDVNFTFSSFFKDHCCKSTMNVEYLGRSDLSLEGVNSEEEKAIKKLDNYLLSASVYTPRFLAPYAAFVTIPDQRKICRSFLMRDYGCFPSHQSELSEGDFSKISHLYKSVRNVLKDDAIGRLPTALKYYLQAFRRDIDPSVAFLGAMMAMEALFGSFQSEIAHQISERVAFFLKDNPDGRESLYKEVKRHYDLRSKIAHGTSHGKKYKLQDMLGNILHTLKDVLVRVLEDPTLLEHFNSNEEKFSEAMRHLIFHGKMK